MTVDWTGMTVDRYVLYTSSKQYNDVAFSLYHESNQHILIIIIIIIISIITIIIIIIIITCIK